MRVAVDGDRIQPAKAGGFTIQVSWVPDSARDRLQVVGGLLLRFLSETCYVASCAGSRCVGTGCRH